VEAVEQASAENLLGGFVIVGGHVGFDILLPVFGLHIHIMCQHFGRTNEEAKGINESILTAVGKVARSFS
jgi:hypothetical protein